MSKPILTVKQLTKRYGSNTIFENIDLTVNEGGVALKADESLDEGAIPFSRRIEVTVMCGAPPRGLPDPLDGVEFG